MYRKTDQWFEIEFHPQLGSFTDEELLEIGEELQLNSKDHPVYAEDLMTWASDLAHASARAYFDKRSRYEELKAQGLPDDDERVDDAYWNTSVGYMNARIMQIAAVSLNAMYSQRELSQPTQLT